VFDVFAAPLPKADSMQFKALQTYSDGAVVRWIEPKKADGSEPEHPAPTLKLTPAVAEGASASAAPTGSAISHYLEPSFGRVHLTVIDPPMVRTWRARLLDAGVSQSMVAKAYRLLRGILMTAVEQDELIRRNPCRIVGAGTESPDERPVLSIEQVCVLADLMPARQRMLIMVATFASLRYGEVTALRRMDIDQAGGAVSVRQAFTEVRGQGMVLGPPKSRAGLRTVGLPSGIVAELRDHLARFVSSEPTALVFTGPYQHATREADRVIADALDARLGVLREPAKEVVPDPDKGESRGLTGTEVARELHEGRF
jgi:Domain of unkown function (DUF1775)